MGLKRTRNLCCPLGRVTDIKKSDEFQWDVGNDLSFSSGRFCCGTGRVLPSQGVLEISVTIPSLSVLSVASVKPWFRTMVWNFQVSLELKSNGEINLFKIVVSENQQNYEINGELKMIFNNKSF